MTDGPLGTVVPRGVTLRLILVRHGESHESASGRCCGTLDPPLSDCGRQQMQWARGFLRKMPVVAIYSSPKQRALESARALEHGLPIAIDNRLSEIDFGALEGLPYDEIAQRHPDVWRCWMERPTEVVFPSGERFTVFCARVEEAIADIRKRHRNQAIVVVAHGGVNRVILAHALALDIRHMFRLQQTCGGVSILDVYEEGAVVQLMNATSNGPGGSC
jgi:alpha-ribazole phosphatase